MNSEKMRCAEMTIGCGVLFKGRFLSIEVILRVRSRGGAGKGKYERTEKGAKFPPFPSGPFL